MARKPYNERTDIEKLESQWKKTSSLHSKNQASAAVVRAATAAEIAANIAIREEFRRKSTLPAPAVDRFLRWANGLNGKVTQLLLPLTFDCDERSADYKQLLDLAGKINKTRNEIVHSGNYANVEETIELCTHVKAFVEMLVGRYHPGYMLPAIARSVSSKDASDNN